MYVRSGWNVIRYEIHRNYKIFTESVSYFRVSHMRLDGVLFSRLQDKNDRVLFS